MPTKNQQLKESLGREALGRIARSIKGVHGVFDERAFQRAALRGLDELELKARVTHIIAVLRRFLPSDVPQAIETLARAGERWEPGKADDPLSALAAWPVTDFVAEYGLEHFDPSMDALRRLTGLFSSEFAIRPFIARYPERTLKQLQAWTQDPDAHTRRLVSEGTRPRLPWGKRLRDFQRDPAPVLALLEKLKDDPSEYVRRSVANNLNDISKDHPGLVVEVGDRWARGASAQRQWIIRHALRSLIKAGDPGALRNLGYDPEARLKISGFKITPTKLQLGEDLHIAFQIASRASGPQALVVDYALHFVRHSSLRASPHSALGSSLGGGGRGRKVFKLKTCTLAAGERLTVEKIHKFRQITTRRHYAGSHAVEIIINGVSRAQAEFELLL